jgi:adenylate cyclase
LIAEHLEAAGDPRAAFNWHMRAGAWSGNRDAVAAHMSWQRARQVTDALPDDDPDRIAMRIAARTVLCANAFRVHLDISGGLFEELRQLCAAAGDKRSLAIGMAGLVEVHMMYGRLGEASRMAAETMALIESIGDPTLTVRLSMFPIVANLHTGEIAEALRWSQTVIDLADGELARRDSIVLTVPLAHALATRGSARCALGNRGWRTDLDQAVAKARSAGPLTYGTVISYSYGLAISSGVLLADDAALRDIEEAVRIAEKSSDDLALGLARFTLGVALMHRDSPAERERAPEVLGQVRDMCLDERLYSHLLPSIETWAARERARRGDRDGAIPLLREAVDDLFQEGQLWSCIGATAFLVETLLDRGAKLRRP